MPAMNIGYTQLILDHAHEARFSIPMKAYALATAFWETNRTMLPVEEAYYLGERAEAYRKKLRYYPWHGRGFAQLTWESNYIRAGKELDVDLISRPERAMEPEIAARVLVCGMRDGWFTGKKMSDYFTRFSTDYTSARRIINGTDSAKAIADIALQYEHQLSPEPDYPNIRRGSVGASVSKAQILLSAMGYSVGPVDGIFGARTDAATRYFQRSEALNADGIIGPQTWARLLSHETGDI
ncbi:putative peptidoglycan binding protein [Gemmobacter caeni]|uniref:Putative peptidoglycan binding protein n=1 Tax=Gemmobacter caeni TaxID=589035 RepID=A0A2T6AZ38_9RHOB|nr:peptidoglycan-binding protein [Gemmobacter caeni]PTX49070.1 putative peptidoglycan binding protein [Gemmobacter caeni]TWI98929.1 putative peptidoglycan binding protein [Gemmobacter caeni]